MGLADSPPNCIESSSLPGLTRNPGILIIPGLRLSPGATESIENKTSKSLTGQNFLCPQCPWCGLVTIPTGNIHFSSEAPRRPLTFGLILLLLNSCPSFTLYYFYQKGTSYQIFIQSKSMFLLSVSKRIHGSKGLEKIVYFKKVTFGETENS